MLPHTVDQFLWFILVVALGVTVSRIVVMPFFMEGLLDSEKLAEGASPEEKKKIVGARFQGYVGAIEIILYATAVVYRHPEFILLWFATKYISSMRYWVETPLGRTFYNRSLFGSGLSILLGVITGGCAQFAIRWAAER